MLGEKVSRQIDPGGNTLLSHISVHENFGVTTVGYLLSWFSRRP